MSQEKKERAREDPAVEIDYDHIDVARIMDEIKKKIARQPGPKRSFLADVEPERLEEAQGLRKKIKRIMLKIMSPFSPLIKLLILPVYEEHRQTVLILDNANKKLDRLIYITEREREYIKLLHNLCHNLVVEISKLKIEEDVLKTKMQIMEKDFEFLGKRERALEREIFR
jgi:hypothetical protein